MDPLEKVTLDGLEKFTYISSLLSNEERQFQLCELSTSSSLSYVDLIIRERDRYITVGSPFCKFTLHC